LWSVRFGGAVAEVTQVGFEGCVDFVSDVTLEAVHDLPLGFTFE
jgi:hypothetical protein